MCTITKQFARAATRHNVNSMILSNFIPEYGKSQHNLRHNNICLPAIRCEYEKINAKYQMHYRLRELANPSRPPLYPIVFNRVPETTAYSWWNCQMSSTSANCCQLIPQDRATVCPALGQLAAAELTHHSLKPLRLPYSSRLRLSLLLAGDVHPNSGSATQYPCAVCTSDVTSRGVSFKCNQCSGCVHLKCSGLQNAAQYRKTKYWACSSCNSPYLE